MFLAGRIQREKLPGRSRFKNVSYNYVDSVAMSGKDRPELARQYHAKVKLDE